MIEPELLRPATLVDEIAFRLQTAILDGTYPPGTHLVQDELCERFGVSRTPVREALRRLEARHLVELVANKGATVRAPGRREVTEVYAIRAQLEGFAAELAAGGATTEEFEELLRAQRSLVAAVERLDKGLVRPQDEVAFDAEITQANEAFHTAVHRASRNRRLQLMIAELSSFFPKDAVWRAVRSSEDAYALNVDDHERVARAIGAGDGSRALAAMRDHVLHAGSIVVAYLDEHDFWR